MNLYHVTLTEDSTGNQDWQVRTVNAPANVFCGSAPLGRATVYVLSPVAAKNERDARAHALTMIKEEGLRGN